MASFLSRLDLRAAGAPVALGADFPLGVPREYARQLRRQGHARFMDFLRAQAGTEPFFQVCDRLDEVCLDRPFYPRHGQRGVSRAAHAASLGLPGPSALLRLCDRATALRPAGAPPFWTLGANQSGRAALSAWRDLLLPALHGHEALAVWPFDGGLHELLRPGWTVVAETYPAEALRQLGLHLGGSKRRQADRAGLYPGLAAALLRLGASADPVLVSQAADGFGAGADGEDRLDCLLGVLCVIAVLDGHRPDHVPRDPWIRDWEGWVLGQTSPDAEA